MMSWLAGYDMIYTFFVPFLFFFFFFVCVCVLLFHFPEERPQISIMLLANPL